MLFVIFRRNRLVQSPCWLVLLVYRRHQDGGDMMFTLPFNSASISDISYVTGTGENGKSGNELQMFNLFVAKTDIALATKHFQFHIIMNKRYRQRLIVMTIKFYFLLLH